MAETEAEPLLPVPASAAHAAHRHRKSNQPASALVPATAANVPQLHSDPTAPAQMYLDFTGAAATQWDGEAVPATPAYDTDGKPATFSDVELANIREIWSRVAEKFSPFNLDVTTVDPGQYVKGQALRIVIGGDGTWTGGTYGGYSIPGGFQTDSPTSWIFPAHLNGGDPQYVAEAIAHEAGHDFGLEHQSIFSGTTKINEYNSGTSQKAPIMGRSYYAQRGLWWVGPNSNSGATQDDMAIIAGPVNGFGYRPEDHGQSAATADPLTGTGGLLSGSGVISATSDTDFYSFTTPSQSSVMFTAKVAQYGPTLHLKLALLDSTGHVIVAADSDSLGQTLSADLPAGSYRIEVASHGDYGDVGQYTLSGAVAVAASPAYGQISASAMSDPAPLTAFVTSAGVRLNWSTTWANDTRLGIYRSVDGGATWTQVALTRRHATRYTDSAAPRGTVCCYRVGPSTAADDPGREDVVVICRASPVRAGVFGRQSIVKSIAVASLDCNLSRLTLNSACIWAGV
jgi:hypothetical protein